MLNEKISKYYLLFTLFISGAVVLVLEIAGTRVLAPFFGSTIFVWSSLITITLGFLALGYWIGGKYADKYPRHDCFYTVIYLGAASAMFLLKLNQYILVFSDKLGFKFGPLLASVLLFAFPLFLLSMAGPFAIRLLSVEKEKSGSASGMVFGLSTVGSLVGALLTGFVLIPYFPLSFVLTAALVKLAAIAIMGLIIEKAGWKTIAGYVIILIALIFIPVFKYKDDVKTSVIHEEPSYYADLKVVETPYVRTLLMDGMSQSVTGLHTVNVYNHETLQLERILKGLPEDAEMLVLGFGAGNTAEILRPSLRIDYVELEDKMYKLAEKYFKYKKEENDNTYVEDARAFMRKNGKKYDLVFVDIYHGSFMPYHVCTKEAVELMKKSIKDDGIVVANILGEVDSPLTKALVKTFAFVFPKVRTSKMNNEEGVTNILVYGYVDDKAAPDLAGRHHEISIDTADAVVLTDDRNPTEYLASSRFGALRDIIKMVFGYESMFSI